MVRSLQTALFLIIVMYYYGNNLTENVGLQHVALFALLVTWAVTLILTGAISLLRILLSSLLSFYRAFYHQ